MNNKLSEEQIELILEGAAEPSETVEAELEVSRWADELLKETLPVRPVPPSKLDSFKPYPVRKRFNYLLPTHLVAAAAVVIIIAAASILLFTMTQTGPKADETELQAAITMATDPSLPPADLASARSSLLKLLANNHGSWADQDVPALFAQMESAWRASAARTESEARAGLASSVAGDRIAKLEATITECEGLVSSELTTDYRAAVSESLEAIDGAFAAWRQGQLPDTAWAGEAWTAAADLFTDAPSQDREKAWLCYRALVDGATADDLERVLARIPRNMLLPLSLLSAQVVSRKFALHSEVLSTPNLFRTVGSSMMKRVAAEDAEAIATLGHFAARPLYTAFFLAPGDLPPMLRRATGNIDALYRATDAYLSQYRISSEPVARALLGALELNDQLLLASTEGFFEHTLYDLATEAATLDPSVETEVRHFMKRINFVRWLSGSEQLVPVFHAGDDIQDFSVPTEALGSQRPDLRACKLMASSSANRVKITAIGSGSVKFELFKGSPGFTVPDNHRAPMDDSGPREARGDAQGQF